MSDTPRWVLNEIQRVKEQEIKRLELDKLDQFPVEIFELGQLDRLEISGSFDEIPDQFHKLANLKFLMIRGWYKSIPESITELRNLERLYIDGQYSYIPGSIERLSRLVSLTLHGLYEELPKTLYNLKQLRYLYLGHNRLKSIAPEFLQLKNLFEISMHDDSYIQSPPREIINQGVNAIRQYFLFLQEEENDHIYEAKLLILGEGGAGKTTLARKLQDGNAEMPPASATTEGVEIHQWYFPMQNGKQFRINLWDFGGQEIYHATHQYFLTSRSLYALVADNRKEDTDFNYWLNVVELLSENSPLLIINNEKENRQREINETQLKGRFGNLEGILSVNLQSNRGLEALRKAICYEIEKLPHVGTSLPKSWVQIRHTLEEDSHNYISYSDYLNICENFNISDESRTEIIIGYLHDLGVCLHFKNDPILSQYVILKPHWGTSAAYAVLDSELVINNMGRFTLKDLQTIWTDHAYKGMHRALLQLMLNFKLCYQIPKSDEYIAPQLLSKNQKTYDWDDTENLYLRYHYEFMPKGIILQFIVAMHKEIEDDLVWRTGLVVSYGRARAEVMEDYTGHKIFIRVSGKDKQELRGIISREFDIIHATYRELRYKKLIPCTCAECRQGTDPYFFLYEAVKRADDKNSRIQCQLSMEMINPKELLRDIVDGRKRVDIFDDEFFNFPTEKPDIFLSYARTDAGLMQKIKTALEQRGLKVWVDLERIEVGADSWKNKIQEGLESASCLLLLASPDAKKSEWVGKELDYAAAQKKPIFVFLIRGDEATALKFGDTSKQYIDLQKNPNEGMKKMVQSIKQKLGIN